MKIEFSPIGIINTPFDSVKSIPIQPSADHDTRGWIEIYDEYAGGLADLDGFSHIYLIFHLHKCTRFNLKVIPFLDTVERGIFSTRSPARPNPIGLSVVRLVSVEKNIISIQGLDILNGTPLLDIKPFVPPFENADNIRIGWFAGKEDKIPGRVSDGRFEEKN